jgi:uncharacterized protein
MGAGKDLSPAYAALAAVLAPLGSACVAFSGGVDSSLVLAAAARELGAANVIAFTASSETYRDAELAEARDFVAGLGLRHVVRNTAELADERFAANPRERCYFCKSALVDELVAVAKAEGVATLLDGANIDDQGDWRPGLRATRERGVRHPLIEAGLGKADVRELAHALGLPTWDKPQQACLASRIPYGDAITVEKLRQIEAAEDVLRELGFAEFRVRHHGPVARIEVAEAEIGRAANSARAELARRLRALGFTYVTLDLTGFRSGSMNEVADAGGDLTASSPCGPTNGDRE